MRNFNVPSYLEECFGSDEVESVYMQLPGSGILSYDAPDEDYAFAAHMILMFGERFAHHADGEAGAEGSVQENFGRGVEVPDGDFSDFLTSNDDALLRVSGYYGIEPEHAREIMKQLFRKGILYTDMMRNSAHILKNGTRRISSILKSRRKWSSFCRNYITNGCIKTVLR